MDSLEQIAFLKAILTIPEEDTARLVYADWLEENSNGRDGWHRHAEFIRMQVDGKPHLPPLMSLIPFEKLLEKEPHQFSRTADAGFALVGGGCASVTFKRGFAEKIVCGSKAWLDNANDLYWNPAQVESCSGCLGRECPNADDHVVWPDTKLGPPEDYQVSLVRRQCPSTAQPIKKVTFTVMDAQSEYMSSSYDLAYFQVRWPWIEFRFAGEDPKLTATPRRTME